MPCCQRALLQDQILLYILSQSKQFDVVKFRLVQMRHVGFIHRRHCILVRSEGNRAGIAKNRVLNHPDLFATALLESMRHNPECGA